MFPKLVQLMRMLGEAQWLAKNVIFVFTEDRCDSEDIIDQWLYQYHTGLDTYVDIQSGNIISALVLGYISDYEKSFQMSTNAGDGLLPNLDLVTMFRCVTWLCFLFEIQSLTVLKGQLPSMQGAVALVYIIEEWTHMEKEENAHQKIWTTITSK